MVQAGVPGYTGHVPHGIGAEPHVVSGRVHHLASTDAFATKEHKALDQTRPHSAGPRPVLPPPPAAPQLAAPQLAAPSPPPLLLHLAPPVPVATSPRPSKSSAASSPPARAPAALVQHVRPVVSKYGGMIAAGTTVAVPPQPWEGSSPRLSEESVIAFKSKPNFSKAGAIVTDDQGANRRDGYAGRSGSTNMTLCESEPSFRARSPPVGTVSTTEHSIMLPALRLFWNWPKPSQP